MKKILSIPILLGIFFSVFLIGNVVAEEKEGLEIGNKAPDFEVTTLKGEEIQLSDLEGKPVMLNFWATWCPPCRTEMPDMQKFQENHDVTVLAVNLTDTEANKESVNQFVEQFGLTFQVGLDSDGSVAKTYRINPIPTTFMIDSKGEISHKTFGAMKYETMVEELEKMN
ncbi:redoxin domain-containing protein [Oceanobacillus halophilus]|uniref:TlpA family protein disulfide reductase n=1 Tax=Oceanobacillus halophilus TaxID=930130 RepID=A0A494ZXP8_9BACI|nr:redoxin domain-containing protein [Oceanobacillus halophilus]RKQ31354.1 TlpA family protein disulfide reductase [Oceanobacillus halophilus]